MDDKPTIKDAAALFTDPYWNAKFPPLLNSAQAAELLQVPLQTLYAWSSQGLLNDSKGKAGKRLLFRRNQLLLTFLKGGLNGAS